MGVVTKCADISSASDGHTPLSSANVDLNGTANYTIRDHNLRALPDRVYLHTHMQANYGERESTAREKMLIVFRQTTITPLPVTTPYETVICEPCPPGQSLCPAICKLITASCICTYIALMLTAAAVRGGGLHRPLSLPRQLLR